ncbi:MAG TPA: hypothetical protein VEZ11_17560 [Thermoanaerobaculia bacterium]|nr:hypothetical protein [Thermoanaerobaculia bacterium]
MKRLAFCFLLLLPAAPSAFAWGVLGHLISNEAATFGLPNDMPAFFYRSFPELVYLGPDPDRWNGNGESLDAVNLPDHYLDFEYVEGLDLPRDRYKFIALLNTSGVQERHRLKPAQPGFLPWRIAELSELLTAQFRLWRRSEPNSPDRRAIERGIIEIAGLLGHYVADAANPHHTTMSHNGWVGPNPNGYAIDCETHRRFESDFVSHTVVTSDVVSRMPAPVLRSDYFATAVALVRSSHALVETLYTIDHEGGFDLMHPSERGKDFAANRLASGASLLRDLWWSAWKNSAAPPPKRQQPPPE